MSEHSLIDVADNYAVDLWVVFRKADKRVCWLWKWLKPGYQHVEIWRYVPPGAWIRLDVNITIVPITVFADPPWVIIDEQFEPKCVRVRRTIKHGAFRMPFFVGPITCVELAKAFLGVGSVFVRTPYQLFKYLTRE